MNTTDVSKIQPLPTAKTHDWSARAAVVTDSTDQNGVTTPTKPSKKKPFKMLQANAAPAPTITDSSGEIAALIQQFASDLEALFNGTVSDDLIAKIKADLAAILTKSGVDPSKVDAMVGATLANINQLKSSGLQNVLGAIQQLLNSLTDPSLSSEEVDGLLASLLNSIVQNTVDPTNETPTDRPETKANVSQLFAYFTAIMLIQVALASDQSKASNQINDVTNSMVTLLKQARDQAKTDLDKYEANVEKQKNQSLLQKIFSGIVSGLLCVVGVITGQPALCMMGIFSIVMQFSGGQDALDKALSNLPGGAFTKILCELAIAVGQAVVTGGITGALQGGELVAGEVAAGAVADGAAAAVEDGAAVVIEEGAEESSRLANVLKYLKGGKIAGGNFISELSKMLVMSPFWQDIMTQVAKGFTSDKDKQQIIGMVLGMVVGLATAAGTSFLEDAGSGSVSERAKDFMTGKLGDAKFDQMQMTLKLGTFIMNVAAAAFGIRQAQTLGELSGIQKDQGVTAMGLSVYDGLIAALNGIFSQLQSAMSSVQGEVGNIMQSADKYLAPFSPNSYYSA